MHILVYYSQQLTFMFGLELPEIKSVSKFPSFLHDFHTTWAGVLFAPKVAAKSPTHVELCFYQKIDYPLPFDIMELSC